MVPIPLTTNAQGAACVDGLVLSSFVGDYTVTETVPFGYVPDGAVAKNVAVTAAASCPAGDLVTFSNTPLTNISVSVDSIIPGGTSSTVSCTGFAPVTTDATGDTTVGLNNLLAGSYTCTVVIAP